MKIKFIVLLVVIFLFVGCSESNNSQGKSNQNKVNLNDVAKVEIISADFSKDKVVLDLDTKKDEINKLVNLINESQYNTELIDTTGIGNIYIYLKNNNKVSIGVTNQSFHYFTENGVDKRITDNSIYKYYCKYFDDNNR